MRTDDPIADSFAKSMRDSATTTYDERKHAYIKAAIGMNGEFDVTDAQTIQAAFFDLSREDAEKITRAARNNEWLMGGAIMNMVERYARHRANIEWLNNFGKD